MLHAKFQYYRLLVLKKKILKVFTVYGGHVGHLGHVTIYIKFCYPKPWMLKI